LNQCYTKYNPCLQCSDAEQTRHLLPAHMAFCPETRVACSRACALMMLEQHELEAKADAAEAAVAAAKAAAKAAALAALPDSITLPDHAHPLLKLTPHPTSRRWRCDVCDSSKDPEEARFHCAACDYDGCEKCVQAQFDWAKGKNTTEVKHDSYETVTIAKTSSGLTASENNHRFTNVNSSWRFLVAALGTPCNKFSVKLIKQCKNLIFGFDKEENFNFDGGVIRFIERFPDVGYYLMLGSNRLYVDVKKGREEYKFADEIDYEGGTIVTCEWRPQDGSIRYYLNGVDKGAAFTLVPDGAWLPAFLFVEEDCCVELCANP